jgi:ATP-dependent helicase HrpA
MGCGAFCAVNAGGWDNSTVLALIFTEVFALSDSPLQIEFPESLPVSAKREEIMDAMAAHQVIIVCGETGSGKTTQLPKIALAMGRGKLNYPAGQRGASLATRSPGALRPSSVAKRIAEELKTPLGEVVGYKVRFQDRLEPRRLRQAHDRRHFAGRNANRPAAQAYDTSSSTRRTSAA